MGSLDEYESKRDFRKSPEPRGGKRRRKGGDGRFVIGEGYGAGRVIVWDAGTWRPLTDAPVEEALENGHLSFWLEGETQPESVKSGRTIDEV
jgi:hypothetical protein